jgi:single-stranded-DNA-specific exonuclease
VIGIVASRLVERYHRPVVLIAGGEANWKGSGRSVAAFDLHEALSACSDHLVKWGGHRAAAGLSISPPDVDAFARAFAEHADGMLSEEELAPVTPIDAIVPRGVSLTLELAQELAQLAPFGLGNPGVTLLAPACELRDLGTVGDGKHLKFRVRDESGGDAGCAIAFRLGSHLDRLRRAGRFDVVFRLQENRWNGTVAPQLVVRRVLDGDERYVELADWFRGQWKGENRDPVAQEIFDELGLESGVKRSLLESERFRALLAEPAALPAAA